MDSHLFTDKICRETPVSFSNTVLSFRASGKSANLAAACIRVATASLHSLGHSLKDVALKRL